MPLLNDNRAICNTIVKEVFKCFSHGSASFASTNHENAIIVLKLKSMFTHLKGVIRHFDIA